MRLDTALVINVNTLALDYHNIEHDEWFYLCFTVVAEGFFYFYWVEFLIKFVGLGPGGYFATGARQFEFIMLVASVAERSTSTIEINPMILRILRVSRMRTQGLSNPGLALCYARKGSLTPD